MLSKRRKLLASRIVGVLAVLMLVVSGGFSPNLPHTLADNAREFTLEDVGGSVKINRLYYQDTPAEAYWIDSDGNVTNGTLVTAGLGSLLSLRAVVSFHLDFTDLRKGDSIVIPYVYEDDPTWIITDLILTSSTSSSYVSITSKSSKNLRITLLDESVGEIDFSEIFSLRGKGFIMQDNLPVRVGYDTVFGLGDNEKITVYKGKNKVYPECRASFLNPSVARNFNGYFVDYWTYDENTYTMRDLKYGFNSPQKYVALPEYRDKELIFAIRFQGIDGTAIKNLTRISAIGGGHYTVGQEYDYGCFDTTGYKIVDILPVSLDEVDFDYDNIDGATIRANVLPGEIGLKKVSDNEYILIYNFGTFADNNTYAASEENLLLWVRSNVDLELEPLDGVSQHVKESAKVFFDDEFFKETSTIRTNGLSSDLEEPRVGISDVYLRYFDNGTLLDTIAGKYGDVQTLKNLNSLKRIGFKFAGWNTAADGSGDWYQPGDSFTLGKGVNVLYAQWEALPDSVAVTPGFEDNPGDDPARPDGYVSVKFAGGEHGSLSGSSVFHVNPNKKVTLTAPGVKADTGWKHSGWDKVFADVQFSEDAVITAQYAKIDDSVGGSDGFEDNPGDDPARPDGYVSVTFDSGSHGSASGTRLFHVNPTKNVTLVAPSIIADTGWKFTGWNKNFTNAKFTSDTRITAQYEELDATVPVTPGYEDNPGDDPARPDGYVSVVFDRGDHGGLTGARVFHVNPNKKVTLTAPVVTADDGYTFTAWDKAFTNATFTADTTIKALYAADYLGPDTDPSKVPDTHVAITTAAGDHAKFADGSKSKLVGYVSKTNEVDVTDKVETPTPDKGYTNTGWDKPLKGVFKQATTITMGQLRSSASIFDDSIDPTCTGSECKGDEPINFPPAFTDKDGNPTDIIECDDNTGLCSVKDDENGHKGHADVDCTDTDSDGVLDSCKVTDVTYFDEPGKVFDDTVDPSCDGEDCTGDDKVKFPPTFTDEDGDPSDVIECDEKTGTCSVKEDENGNKGKAQLDCTDTDNDGVLDTCKIVDVTYPQVDAPDSHTKFLEVKGTSTVGLEVQLAEPSEVAKFVDRRITQDAANGSVRLASVHYTGTKEGADTFKVAYWLDKKSGSPDYIVTYTVDVSKAADATASNGGSGTSGNVAAGTGVNAGSGLTSGSGLHSGGLSSTGATVGYLALVAGVLLAAGAATRTVARRRKADVAE
ncbi:MAG: InlB B-repeat-containing protein [Actinomycetaceae bacterium]|nr:InlB B-repeat-containing protein [Actinomycetaceae bacterium]